MERKISHNHINPLVVALILSALFLLLTATLSAQNVAINTDGSKADANAIVDIKSSTKGLLIPRMTTAQRMKIPQTTGLIIYDVTTKSFWYSDGESWKNMSSAELSSVTTDAWLLTGNAGTIDGTHFLGTTDNVPLNFRVNNQKAGRVDPLLSNTFLGYRSAFLNVSGHDNTAVGGSALFSLQGGSNNTAVGSNALQTNGGGQGNTAVGRMALLSNTLGENNVAVGLSALMSNIRGGHNVAMGPFALQLLRMGNSNTAVGSVAMWFKQSGEGNTAVGVFALAGSEGSQNTGSANTALGWAALATNTNGNNNTAIGSGANVSAPELTNATALGSGAIVNASNKVRIGNAAVTVIEGQVPFSFPSDGRYKFNVREDVHGLDFIMQLRPVTYQFDVKRFDGVRVNANAEGSMKVIQASYNEASMVRRSGFIAQEVDKAAETSGYNFSGLNKPKTDKDHYSLSYESFVVPLVKAVQEQQQIINAQTKRLDAQDRKIDLLIKELEELKNKDANK